MRVLGTVVADTTAAAESNPQDARVSEGSTLPQQVLTTPAADGLIAQLVLKHGPVMFHQSGGCCDGSSPMCYPAGEFLVGDSDVLLGRVGAAASGTEDASMGSPAMTREAGAPFYISRSQFEYWKHTQLILDVVPGRGGMFSLENGEGVRFLIRSRVFTDAEIAVLRAAGRI